MPPTIPQQPVLPKLASLCLPSCILMDDRLGCWRERLHLGHGAKAEWQGGLPQPPNALGSVAAVSDMLGCACYPRLPLFCTPPPPFTCSSLTKMRGRSGAGGEYQRAFSFLAGKASWSRC